MLPTGGLDFRLSVKSPTDQPLPPGLLASPLAGSPHTQKFKKLRSIFLLANAPVSQNNGEQSDDQAALQSSVCSATAIYNDMYDVWDIFVS